MKYQKKLIVACLVFIFAIFYAVIPLFGKSYIPTHDGEYHIIRIVEFARMLGAGYLFPRWGPNLNSGYGIPIFEYNYPFPNYVGSLLRALTHDAVYAFQMSMGVGYILVAIGMFYWLSVLFSPFAAFIGATVGAFVPYLFVDMYVRGSIGEIWATAFLFWALFCIERKRYAWFALVYALLILSHNILGMLYTPFLLGYAILRDKKVLLWMLVGIGLSAYFWLPALVESRYVVGLNTVNFREHFVQFYELLIPSWGTEFSGVGSFTNKISFQIGMAPLIAIVGAFWIGRSEGDKKKKQLFSYLLLVTALCIFLMLSFSVSLWEIFRPLQFMQYPWRLLSFIVPVAAYSTAFWAARIKKIWVGICIGIAAVLLASSYARPVLYQPRNEAYYLARPNFTDGTSSMGNSFSTIWTGWKDTRPSAAVTIQNGKLIASSRSNYLDKEFRVRMEKDEQIRINTTYFPGWRVTVDSHVMPILYHQSGLIEVLVPHGDHTIHAWFGETQPRLIGDILSGASAMAILGYTLYRKRKVEK